MKEIGIRRTDKGIFCESCGSDLSVSGSTKFIAHWDGTKEYGYKHQCTKCGATLEQIMKRTPENAKMWR